MSPVVGSPKCSIHSRLLSVIVKHSCLHQYTVITDIFACSYIRESPPYDQFAKFYFREGSLPKKSVFYCMFYPSKNTEISVYLFNNDKPVLEMNERAQ